MVVSDSKSVIYHDEVRLLGFKVKALVDIEASMFICFWILCCMNRETYPNLKTSRRFRIDQMSYC